MFINCPRATDLRKIDEGVIELDCECRVYYLFIHLFLKKKLYAEIVIFKEQLKK